LLRSTRAVILRLAQDPTLLSNLCHTVPRWPYRPNNAARQARVQKGLLWPFDSCVNTPKLRIFVGWLYLTASYGNISSLFPVIGTTLTWPKLLSRRTKSKFYSLKVSTKTP